MSIYIFFFLNQNELRVFVLMLKTLSANTNNHQYLNSSDLTFRKESFISTFLWSNFIAQKSDSIERIQIFNNKFELYKTKNKKDFMISSSKVEGIECCLFLYFSTLKLLLLISVNKFWYIFVMNQTLDITTHKIYILLIL